MSAPAVLFSDGELSEVLERRARAMEDELAKAPEEHLLQVDTDQWAEALALRYALSTPVLEPENWWMDPPEEIKVDVRYDGFSRLIDDFSRPALVNGFRNVVHVPYKGDPALFKFSPNSRDSNPPRADIGSDDIRLVVEYPADAPQDVKAQAEIIIASIQKYLGWVREAVDSNTHGLDARARAAIQARRQRVQDAYERLQETGIPMRRPGASTKTYIADVLVRRPAPALIGSRGDAPIALEPVLSDTIFEHILRVIRSTGEAMERSPGTYVGMGEEDRRQVLLTALNTHYQGLTTAEAFNVSGKTDLLVRHPEGRNLFIGECKFWEGQKAFSQTIDQLFSYSAWRDSKLAVVMFVGERDLTSVLEKARKALTAHPQFAELRPAKGETEMRAIMSWPGDVGRLADLSVLFVHIPAASRSAGPARSGT